MLLNHVLDTDTTRNSDEIRLLAEESVGHITQAITKYGLPNIALAFNGGKDCTVLLHLVHIALSRLGLNNSGIVTLCIETDEVFPELNNFIEQSAALYRLNLVRKVGKIKDALFELKEAMPHISAVLMGTRSTDPYSAALRTFTPCDSGWPELMRVSPILTWSYAEVWRFIQELNVPYCSLYDVGYTSLGNVNNTRPNPALLAEDGISYKPAHFLTDSTLERAGRR